MIRRTPQVKAANAPYASIILPTHDRAATLGLAIDAALRQTRTDIELLVVGDGCSESCRRVARQWEAADPRVRFLDLPKAPLRGVRNRDFAVRSCASDRIFYTDDDDLLLPQHVATLGPALDNCDVVDTPVVSVAPDGQVDLGLHDSSHPTLRRLLAEQRLKAVFDTHLAHRRDAYMRLAGPWLRATDRRAVLHMLSAFAADSSIRWRTIQSITALSFHGARRVMMSPQSRARELDHWMRRSRNWAFETRLKREARVAFHAEIVATGLLGAGETREEVEAFLGKVLRSGGGPFGPPRRQLAELAGAIAIAAQERPKVGMREAFNALLNARLGPELPAAYVVGRCLRLSTQSELAAILDSPADAADGALAQLALDLAQGPANPSLVRGLDRVFVQAPEDVRFFFAQAVAQCLSAAGMSNEAGRWTDRALPLAPDSFHAAGFWRLQEALCMAAGDQSGVVLAQERLGRCASLTV